MHRLRSAAQRKHRCRVTGLILALMVCGSISAAEDSRLDRIRVQAQFNARLIRSIEYNFEVKDDKGWHARGSLHAEGSRYRVDRDDITGLWIIDKRTTPSRALSAYNDERFQNFNAADGLLLLEDGNQRAYYAIETPHSVAYSWLRTAGMLPIRWDHIVSGSVWDKRFADAVYIGHVDDGKSELEIVEFPQREGVSTPSVYQVSFAPRLGYLPIKFIRRIEATGQEASILEVTRFVELEVDGSRIAVPTEVSIRPTGADSRVLNRSTTHTVAEDSIRINQPVDRSLYELDPAIAKTVYDNDEQARLLAAVDAKWGNQPLAPATVEKINPSLFQSWLLWGNVAAVGAIVLGLLAFKLLPRRP